MNKIIYLFIIILGGTTYAAAQEKVYNTFKDRRVINTQSVEVLQKKQFDFRVAHRFGDLAGAAGGWQNFFGLENAADVQIGFEYGLNEKLTLGLSRTKGAGNLRQLLHGFGKYRVLQQTTDNKMPISMTAVAMATASTMKSSSDTLAISHFPKFSHRFLYSLELHIARKFENFSVQISPIFVWRNYVLNTDQNGLFSLNLAARIRLTKITSLIIDGNLPFAKKYWTANSGYYAPIGAGLEFETGGHTFQINLTNSGGLMSTDYIPETRSNWLKGEFRLGFTISRVWRF